MRVFLLSSFPSLSLDDSSPIGMDEVIMRCADHLPDETIQEIESICSAPPSGTSDFAHKWSTLWQAIQHKNREERSLRMGSETRKENRMLDSQSHHDLFLAWEETDPLKRELGLLRVEWNWLEAKRRSAPFSEDDLFGYLLQVQLLERKDRWEEQAGITQFQTHVRSFLDPVLETLQETPA